jgi:hypothetical protein
MLASFQRKQMCFRFFIESTYANEEGIMGHTGCRTISKLAPTGRKYCVETQHGLGEMKHDLFLAVLQITHACRIAG